MDIKRIIDQIAATKQLLSIPNDWRVVPVGPDDDGRLMIVVDAPMSDEMRDNLRFMFGSHIRELTTDSGTLDRLRAFQRSRFGSRGNGAGHYGEIDCDIAWRFKCPQDWQKLSPTANAWTRHCSTCSRNVVLCGNATQVEAARQVGACVAIARNDEGDVVQMTLGEIR